MTKFFLSELDRVRRPLFSSNNSPLLSNWATWYNREMVFNGRRRFSDRKVPNTKYLRDKADSIKYIYNLQKWKFIALFCLLQIRHNDL